MGSSNSCEDNSDVTKNEAIQWSFQIPFAVAFFIILIFIRKRFTLPIKSFGGIKFLLLKSMGLANALTSISATYFTQNNYSFCNSDDDDFINIWLSFNIIVLIILLCVIYCELQMDKTNTIPQCVLIPYTNNDCACCDGCNTFVSSSKLATKSNILKNWNCARRLYSLLLTWLIFGLTIFFNPFYQLQNSHVSTNSNVCVCTAEFGVILGGFFLSFLTVPIMVCLLFTWFGWCCCKYICKHNCCTACWVGFYRFFAYFSAIIFPAIFVLLRLRDWTQHEFFRWTVSNIYIILYIGYVVIGILIGVIVCYKTRSSNEETNDEKSTKEVQVHRQLSQEIELKVDKKSDDEYSQSVENKLLEREEGNVLKHENAVANGNKEMVSDGNVNAGMNGHRNVW